MARGIFAGNRPAAQWCTIVRIRGTAGERNSAPETGFKLAWQVGLASSLRCLLAHRCAAFAWAGERRTVPRPRWHKILAEVPAPTATAAMIDAIVSIILAGIEEIAEVSVEVATGIVAAAIGVVARVTTHDARRGRAVPARALPEVRLNHRARRRRRVRQARRRANQLRAERRPA
jgi:hypothetical protein